MASCVIARWRWPVRLRSMRTVRPGWRRPTLLLMSSVWRSLPLLLLRLLSRRSPRLTSRWPTRSRRRWPGRIRVVTVRVTMLLGMLRRRMGLKEGI